MCVELLAEFDPFMADHVARFGGKGSGKVNYLSNTTYEELIGLMADLVLKNIIDDIKRAKYFSIIVDSTPDVSHCDQLSVVFRYVGEDGTPVERFIGFLANVGHKSKEILQAIVTMANKYNLNMRDCRGQSYDNASNMSGKYNGLQSLLQAGDGRENRGVSSFAYFTPCAAHSLNLIGENAAKCSPVAIAFFDFLQELYNFFSRSTGRWEELQHYQRQVTQVKKEEQGQKQKSKAKALKSLSQTRWSSRSEACESLARSWNAVFQCLTDVKNNKNLKSDVRSKADGLKRQLEKYETAFLTAFWGFILKKFNKVSIALQAVDTNVLQVMKYYESLVLYVEEARNQFEKFEEEANNVCLSQAGFENKNRRKRVRKLQADETQENEFE